MKTIISKVDILDKKEQLLLLEQVGEILKCGGLVAFPTETVYGLGADALNEDAAKKTYEAKGRPSDNPLIVHIANMDALEGIVREIPQKAKMIAERFWPGPLTMVFHKNAVVPYGTTGGLETVAVRMPDHVLAREIIQAGGGYISAPSANSSGRPSPTAAAHVSEDLAGKIDMIVDGGEVEIGVESTILDMTTEVPMILRPGVITKEMLEEVIGEVSVDRGIVEADAKVAPKAPGMKYRHYAPKAALTIVAGELEASVEAIQLLIREKSNQGYRVGVIGTIETVGRYEGVIAKSIGSREEEESVAHNLYKVLRSFDEEEIDCIYSEAFYGNGIGEAIMNRLLKAAGNKLLEAEDVKKERGSK